MKNARNHNDRDRKALNRKPLNGSDRTARNRYGRALICVLTALAAVTICSKSSPLYPINDWVDANCFFTVGKSMLKGLVPYRDLLEQKGPLLYALHALAALVSWDSFLGVWLIEVAAAALFLFFSCKTVELFHEKAAWTVPFLAAAVYCTEAFCHGDSAEELCLPFLAATFYLAMKAVRTRTDMPARDFFLIGLMAACVFWTKFSLCGIYFGWFVVFAIDGFFHRKAGRVLLSVPLILAGLAVGTLPWLAYFGLHHAIGDWLHVYIYDNLFAYSRIDGGNTLLSLVQALYRGLRSLYRLLPGVILIVLGLVYGIVRKWKPEVVFAAGMCFFAFFFGCIGGRSYAYYALAVAPYACLGLVPVCCLLFGGEAAGKATEKARRGGGKGGWRRLVTPGLCVAYVGVAVLMLYMTPNRYLMGVKKESMPQYEFAAQMASVPGATLLNYGFLDGGFYLTSGTVPNCKAFCKLNMPLEEMDELQARYVREGLCDYVVTRGEPLGNADTNRRYVQVGLARSYLEGEYYIYYLYRLKTAR